MVPLVLTHGQVETYIRWMGLGLGAWGVAPSESTFETFWFPQFGPFLVNVLQGEPCIFGVLWASESEGRGIPDLRGAPGPKQKSRFGFPEIGKPCKVTFWLGGTAYTLLSKANLTFDLSVFL